MSLRWIECCISTSRVWWALTVAARLAEHPLSSFKADSLEVANREEDGRQGVHRLVLLRGGRVRHCARPTRALPPRSALFSGTNVALKMSRPKLSAGGGFQTSFLNRLVRIWTHKSRLCHFHLFFFYSLVVQRCKAPFHQPCLLVAYCAYML